MDETKVTQTKAERVPVTLLAGFLGSGKTTLANRILTEQHNQRIAVIVNEFGDVGIDGSLVVGVEDNIVELSNGCLCCTVRGDLAETLLFLLIRRRQHVGAVPFERILIEASGLASPGPAVQTLLVDPQLSMQLQLDGVITLTHAQHIARQLHEHPEASNQVGYADHIILNHCDQCAPEELEAAEAAIRACNQSAEVLRATHADVDVATLLNGQTWDVTTWQALQASAHECEDPSLPHAHDAHSDASPHTCGVGTVTLRADAPLDLNRLKMWLLFLAKRRSHELMRLKGILHCQHQDEAVVVQGVYQWMEVREGRGKAPAESVLVLIGRDLDRDEIGREWKDCRARM